MNIKLSLYQLAAVLGMIFLLGELTNSIAFQQVPLTLEELANRADCVVRGLVEATTCQKDPEGRIYTRIEFKVLETWKGQVKADRLTLVHSGGEFQGRRVVMPGQVAYAVGEEAVAFLVYNPRGEGVTVGMTQGKFSLWTDPASGAKLAQNHVHNPVPRSAPKLQNQQLTSAPMTLSELRQRVQGGVK